MPTRRRHPARRRPRVESPGLMPDVHPSTEPARALCATVRSASAADPANTKGPPHPLDCRCPRAPTRLCSSGHRTENHQAFEGILNGGIIGTLLDCHSNWAATWHLMRRDGLEKPPVTVTADFHVKLECNPRLRPLRSLEVRAQAVASKGSFVTVEATVSCDDQGHRHLQRSLRRRQAGTSRPITAGDRRRSQRHPRRPRRSPCRSHPRR